MIVIAILAIPIAFATILRKIYLHFTYLKTLPKSTEFSDAFGAFAPLFMSNKELEESHEELRTLAKQIKRSLWIFYISLILFFGILSF